MNEWGTPPWRDLDEYGYYNGWSDDRWRWEFLRRRPEYRAEFEALAAPYRAEFVWSPKIALAEAVVSGLIVPKEELAIFSDEEMTRLAAIAFSDPEGPGFTVSAADPGKYGLYSLLNPAIGDQELWLKFEEYDGFNFFVDDERDEGQLAVTFDLRMPIDLQLQKAREYLLDEQYRYQNPDDEDAPIKKERERRNGRIEALRAIDAKEQEPAIVLREMGEVLWPGQEKAPSRAAEAYARGCRLRDRCRA
ncbi:transcriptional regulator domain-containing protein [Consotaella salsifontis]|uniref:Transcriptional regulator-like domain-containing protein n=1 Tax=Consotaella salsifontis TaxID=1365950 RepID=A0A1T4SJM9_9HYPH|nr:hypothetical protein [Consotaella salsifontis]SKA28375.1 hypothetical protein SAMN05428963_11174 [Consotaella salsifontis]